MQIKQLLQEKERLSEENKQRVDQSEGDMERVKGLEMKINQIFQQKEQVIAMIHRLKDAMPSPNLQRVLSEIIETIYEEFKIEEEQQETESNLLLMEGELR